MRRSTGPLRGPARSALFLVFSTLAATLTAKLSRWEPRRMDVVDTPGELAL